MKRVRVVLRWYMHSGKRFVTTPEINEDTKIDYARFKSFLGGEKLPAKNHYDNLINILPS